MAALPIARPAPSTITLDPGNPRVSNQRDLREWASKGGDLPPAGGAGVLARPRPGVPVYLSPCDEFDEERNQANRRAVAESALKHGYRAGVQLHKVLGLR